MSKDPPWILIGINILDSDWSRDMGGHESNHQYHSFVQNGKASSIQKCSLEHSKGILLPVRLKLKIKKLKKPNEFTCKSVAV